MIETIIPDPVQERSFYHMFSTGDYEYRDAYEQLRLMSMIPQIKRGLWLLTMKKVPFSLALNKAVLERAAKFWDSKVQQATTIDLSYWFTLLDLTKKKEQVKHLKGATLDSDTFFAVLLRAGEQLGFTLSQYRAEHIKGVDRQDLPTLIHMNEAVNNVEIIGKTPLSKGQLKGVLEQRHVVVAKFLDREDDWHCLFVTYKSLRGEEKQWKDGQPHMHYISSGWGMPRQEVVTELKSERYRLNSLPHIDFTR
jgi:hypothetical protein